MKAARFDAITSKYSGVRSAVVGDFCLDRYLEIDAAKEEISIETGLAVHNVVNVRSLPGGAGTILNNLAALGIGVLYPVGFAGDDGEGYELRRALQAQAGVRLDYFLTAADRRTFTYCKPLMVAEGKVPQELSRLDSKNWSATPVALQQKLAGFTRELAGKVDAIILLDQVHVPETGVITASLLAGVSQIITQFPELLILADSRRGLRGYPKVTLKMNSSELAFLAGRRPPLDLATIERLASELGQRQGRAVFVTMAENGILGASPEGRCFHRAAHPVRGEIDIVGAGDAVTANLVAGFAAGAAMEEVLEMANAAASIVIHQLGSTGTASPSQIARLL
jgi:rfaE bifunctional protein kinase chain/domain